MNFRNQSGFKGKGPKSMILRHAVKIRSLLLRLSCHISMKSKEFVY